MPFKMDLRQEHVEGLIEKHGLGIVDRKGKLCDEAALFRQCAFAFRLPRLTEKHQAKLFGDIQVIGLHRHSNGFVAALRGLVLEDTP